MPRSKQPKPRWKRILSGAFYGFFCLFCLFGGAIAAWLGSSDVVRTVLYQSFAGRDPQEAWGGKESVNLLVLGCDEDWYYKGIQRIHDKARSDMMLVAKLDFKNNRITGVSIPRDTLAKVDGYRRQKINAFYRMGGANLSKKAVEQLISVDIDRVVVLNFDAFKQMVDAVGGVRMHVPKDMDYDDNAGHLHIHLKKGHQTLDGEDAVGFVRFRHDDNDFMRQSRQREFMVAFKNSVMRKPGMLPTVADKARAFMGNSLTTDEVASLALFMRSVKSDSIKMGMIPVKNGRGYTQRLDAKKLPKVLREFNFVDERLSSAVSSLR
jgi:polyisoprenyl-teichoic acid--peptidoglycan teichoic acid transferase